MWSLILVFWLILGTLTYFQTYLFYVRRPHFSHAAVIEMALLFTLLWLAVTPLILWLARRFSLERPRLGRHLLLHVTAAILLGSLNRLCFLLIAITLPNLPPEEHLTVPVVLRDLAFHVDNQALLYFAVLGLYEGILYYFKYQESLRRQSQLEAKLAKSQLQALKMQLHPHFLFNTLHTISSMIRIDPEAADLMVVRLSEFLRLSLASEALQEVSLEQELRFIRRYLEIERIRFAERLQVDYDVEDSTLSASVPNLILQPLVENAIRHGVSRTLHRGRIAIKARRRGETLVLSVTDNGAGLSNPAPGREGVGLSNTRARLQQLYGQAQELKVTNRDEGGVEAVLSFPLHATEYGTN